MDNSEENQAQSHAEQPFDREYSVHELMPSSFFSSLHRWLTDAGVNRFFVFDKNGVCIFPAVSDEKHCKMEDIDGSDTFMNDMGDVIVPLNHDFEILAFMMVGFPESMMMESASKIAWCRFAGKMVEQVIACYYRTLMSSGLHSQVVTDSYQEIVMKTELLEKSEKKYRHLAESLEKEVLRKTKEVKEAQAYVMHQEKLASIGHLAAGVAHEINNPMGFITSNLRTLKDYYSDIRKASDLIAGWMEKVGPAFEAQGHNDSMAASIVELKDNVSELDMDYILDDFPHLLDESLDGAERINRIVSDLKDFAHPGEENPTDADLVQCIESTLNMIWNELKYKTTVKRSYEPIPRIYCYARQLNQVIMNLLMNSAQAIDKHGEIEIGTRDQGEWVEFFVKDNGHGIPEEILPKIFDPFFTTKDVGKGTGLGLNLVYNIVKKHHGMINVDSQWGVGTVFTVRLPVHGCFEH